MSVRPSAEGYYEVEDGAVWRRLRLISDVTFSPTPAPETTETTLDEGEVTTIGTPGNPTFSVTVSLNDASRAYRILEDAFYGKNVVNQRQVTGIPSSNNFVSAAGTDTLALAATGVVTGAGTLDFGSVSSPSSPWIPGRLLVLGKKRNSPLADGDIVHIIEGINATKELVATRVGSVTSVTFSYNGVNHAMITPDKTAVAAVNATADYRLMDYAVLESWGGRITQAGAPTRSGTTRNETIQGNCESRPTKRFIVPL